MPAVVPEPEEFSMEVSVRLSPAVKELTFRPAASSLKLPKAVLGTDPAIKLSGAGVQVGVKGATPDWFVVEMTRAAVAVAAKSSQATIRKDAAAGFFGW